MNYILSLKKENASLQSMIETAKLEIQNFREFLNGPKFTGYESDGGRKDWIATEDVILRLREITDRLSNVE